MTVGFELLSAIPGRCGAVSNLWRNNLSLFPLVDGNLKFIAFVTPKLFDYYHAHIDVHENLKFHVCDLNGNSILKRILYQEKEIPKLLREYHCDLYFTGTPTPTFHSNMPLEIFKITGIQFYSRPGEFGGLRSHYHKFATKKKAKRSKYIIVNSKYVKTEILKRIQGLEEKIKVIYESLDHEIFNTETSTEMSWKIISEKWNIDSKFLLYISDMRPYKNPLKLIKAFESLKDDLKDYKLIMIGQDVGGYKNSVVEYIMRKDLGKRIILFDYMEPFDFVDLMRAADVFVYPSSLETFGTIPLEAMACGTPVIAGNKTAIPEICGDAALLVDGKNDKEIAKALVRVLNDDDLRTRLIEKGLNHIKNFSWHKNAEETIKLFHQAFLNE